MVQKAKEKPEKGEEFPKKGRNFQNDAGILKKHQKCFFVSCKNFDGQLKDKLKGVKRSRKFQNDRIFQKGLK